jgi:hypothetical protein
MLQPKHTPGPWTIQAADDITTTVDIRGARGLLVAEVSDSSTEDVANARLIAAAPELLWELQRAVDMIEEMNRRGASQIVPSTMRAAIAKATGGAS